MTGRIGERRRHRVPAVKDHVGRRVAPIAPFLPRGPASTAAALAESACFAVGLVPGLCRPFALPFAFAHVLVDVCSPKAASVMRRKRWQIVPFRLTSFGAPTI